MLSTSYSTIFALAVAHSGYRDALDGMSRVTIDGASSTTPPWGLTVARAAIRP
jgi:hypothetical protein